MNHKNLSRRIDKQKSDRYAVLAGGHFCIAGVEKEQSFDILCGD